MCVKFEFMVHWNVIRFANECWFLRCAACWDRGMIRQSMAVTRGGRSRAYWSTFWSANQTWIISTFDEESSMVKIIEFWKRSAESKCHKKWDTSQPVATLVHTVALVWRIKVLCQVSLELHIPERKTRWVMLLQTNALCQAKRDRYSVASKQQPAVWAELSRERAHIWISVRIIF